MLEYKLVSKEKKILITTALPYANGSLHFGHIAGVYLPADSYARFKRLTGSDVLFISGSDEYGVAVTLSAELAGRTPQEQVDFFYAEQKDVFRKLAISFDHYSRTTTPLHKPIVQEFFLNLLEKGYIEEQETEELYSSKEGRFLADRYVLGECPKCGFADARGDECTSCGASYEARDLKNPRSKLTDSPLTLKKTKHWFLQFDKFKEQLTKWIESKDWRPNVINFILPYIEQLRPRAITRDSKWGVPLPIEGYLDKVLYVWFDAPIGYISATQEWAQKKAGRDDAWKDFWLDPETHYVQFIGKDNIVFHAMLFPAMEMGQKTFYKTVDDLVASEFLLLEGKQFSKSEGWTVDLQSFIEKYPVDMLRYVLAANAPETQDAEFSFQDFFQKANGDLIGKFGNFVHRTLNFIHTKVDGKIPEWHDYDELDNQFLLDIENSMRKIEESYEEFRLRKVTHFIMELADKANAYFDHKKPWVLLKRKEDKFALETMLYCSLMAIKSLAIAAYPIMPAAGEKIWEMLGFSQAISHIRWNSALEEQLTPGIHLPAPTPIFRKLQEEEMEEELELLYKN